ncbi:hypothetical protein GCM10007301_39880 [Azorhizobium oxalatiphilum]|uniref:Class I SAM-dependent methyltransferase n=1 Tax=Azorhizobium oxalatiphilum TaxID=980631 RepID=A0A917CA08_9HYPH|nr:class I SAM-dependent methyltransferase [Azorhizobium oxalatiphilum]GGF75920.1 hypothetical protein GCM10007301_39880 [Azorhizobium oxalatiphilum]
MTDLHDIARDIAMGDAEAERLVIALYQGLLERAPDRDEIASWAAGLTAPNAEHRISAADMAETFLNSEERRTRLAEREREREREREAAQQVPEAPEEPEEPRVPVFVPPGHFYSPIVDVETVRDRIAWAWSNLPERLPGLAIDRAAMVAAWADLLPHLQACPFTAEPDARFRYHFENPAYAHGDGSVLYAMIRRHRPRQLIEIGCGWSSACALDAIERELGGACDVTFIEPYPQLVRDLMATRPFPHRLLPVPVQEVPLAEFARLQRDDILFIDSTHVLKTGSDVWYELCEILPALAPGVIVHFHDVFWPFEYPEEWVLEQNRSWNELYGLRCFLQDNAAWEILFLGNYMSALERPRVAAEYPTLLQNPGGALWLRKLG